MTINGKAGIDYPAIDIDKAVESGVLDADDQVALASVAQINWLCQHVATLEAQLLPIVQMFNAFQASPMAASMVANTRGPIMPPGVKGRGL